MSEADKIVVLDTGSTDNTVKLLKDRNAIVKVETISPWRFDVARNKSMELIPEDTDICVCTDLDEVFEPGWRQVLENAWNKDIKRIKYRYTWSFKEDGSEGTVFWLDQIHAYGCFKWTHPVHEVLEYTGSDGSYLTGTANMQLNHYPDNEKSRSMYFDLLKLSVEEDPNDDRNMHYLGREYMYHEMWDECIDTLKKHLNMPRAVWEDERAASMRYIAYSYIKKDNLYEAKRWLYRAIAEAPHLREPYIDMATLLYNLEDWDGVVFMIDNALAIKERPMTYICEPNSWGSYPYDLISIAYYKLGLHSKSLDYLAQAIQLSPTDERLVNNYEIIKSESSNT